MQERAQAGCGGRLVAADGRELILRDVAIRVDAGGGLARTVLEQRFENPYDEPLALVYQLPLPAAGAVAGFAFRIGVQRVVGEIAGRVEARERFERALLEGRTAGILEQERSSLFTHEIGNVPPRVAVVAEILIDQRLRWVDSGWEWRFPTVVAPRYLGAEGRVSDSARVVVDVVEAGMHAIVSLALSIRDALIGDAVPSSPSHGVALSREGGIHLVRLGADAGAGLDRDLVVRWPVAAETVTTRIEVARPARSGGTPSAYGLLTFVPPASAAAAAARSRDLIVLIDASGSMSGVPFEQARRIASELVRSLDERDTLELIAFASEPIRFRGAAGRATAALRADALEWLSKLAVGGATEMDRAIATALTPLRLDAQRQVVLVTDGLIGFEQEIVQRLLRDLPACTRLHTVGVGSAVNRSLTRTAARAGRGIEVVVGVDEAADGAARRLLAHLDAPIVTEIAITGSAVQATAPARLRDVTAGAPVLVGLELDPAGGEIEIRANGFAQTLVVAPIDEGAGSATIAALFAHEAVDDLEACAAAGDDADAAIERIGLDFAIATRRTSWVAVSEQPTVDPTAPTRHTRIPQAVPYGMSIQGVGLRRSASDVRLMMDVIRMPLSLDRGAAAKRLDFSRDAFMARRLGARGGYGDTRSEPTLSARVVRRSDSELVIEFQVGRDPIRWDPERGGARVSTGRHLAWIPMRIDRAASTAPATIGAGLVIRVVFRLDAPLPATPSEVVVFGSGRRLVVEVRE
jgi:Ca-activated chloride channel family protein